MVSVGTCCLLYEYLGVVSWHSKNSSFIYIVQELMSLLSANLFTTEFERHRLALLHSIESAEAALIQHIGRLRHGMDVSDLISEHKVSLQVFC